MIGNGHCHVHSDTNLGISLKFFFILINFILKRYKTRMFNPLIPVNKKHIRLENSSSIGQVIAIQIVTFPLEDNLWKLVLERMSYENLSLRGRISWIWVKIISFVSLQEQQYWGLNDQILKFFLSVWHQFEVLRGAWTHWQYPMSHHPFIKIYVFTYFFWMTNSDLYQLN